MNYSGKTVWITGASSGIGAELARLFAQEGARVIISSHEAEELEGVRKSLEPVSKEVHTVVFNLGHPEEVEATALCSPLLPEAGSSRSKRSICGEARSRQERATCFAQQRPANGTHVAFYIFE